MKTFRKKVFAACGATTVFMGSGRKEFDPKKPMRTFDSYLMETARETLAGLKTKAIDEGVIGSFMAQRFAKQGNIAGFLPFMVDELYGKPCTGIEGACGTGGRTIAAAVRSVLSGLSDSVFVAAFEVQNTMKAVYGADVLAGAAYYQKERKDGHAYFFPGIFATRAGAYFDKFDKSLARKAMAKWYEQSILNARKNPKAQEYQNTTTNLFELGMSAPDEKKFVPYLNHYDCSKVSDGAASLVIFSEEGLKKCGIDKSEAIEIIALGEAEGDITKDPADLNELTMTKIAAFQAFENAGITAKDLCVLELHDCFTITALLALEALGLANKGDAANLILDNFTAPDSSLPTNLSGGLAGFGHPTGASGVRQLVDLIYQLTGKAENQANIVKEFAMMVSMGGNDKTVTTLIAKKV